MHFKATRNLLGCLFALLISLPLWSQTSVRGQVMDGSTGEPLYDASVVVKSTTNGMKTDFDGYYDIKIDQPLPITILVSYVGFATQEIVVSVAGNQPKITLLEDSKIIGEVEVIGQRIDDQQKKSPLTVEQMDGLAIKQTASTNFYNGLGAMKGVDMTTASLGMTIINMRGFNSTSPVRSLQIIDGVDNQAPGLNFSLGNFLGSGELDVMKVDLIHGASSSFYGPNAFNGVISIETKNPFFTPGLSAQVKGGERNLLDAGIRWADYFKNKAGMPVVGYKICMSGLMADDWVADNYNPVDGTDDGNNNPGGFDKVNVYGDESNNLFLTNPILPGQDAGLGNFHRAGYREVDIVDYNTRNIKTAAAIHIRTKPARGLESPELILASNYGNGTTVYQGDNRFSLRGIQFFQQRIEYRKTDKFFLRAYMTTEDAGRSYDPYFTALRLQSAAKSDLRYSADYRLFWKQQGFGSQMVANGYPVAVFDPITFQSYFNTDSAAIWLADNQSVLQGYHDQAAAFANATEHTTGELATVFYEPGTARFQTAFDSISSRLSTEGGTRFYDKSDLYHLHGQYKFTPSWASHITVGANGRLYTPDSRGTIFIDTAGNKIQNMEVGAYAGTERKWSNDKIITSATIRADKNQNFDLLFTPAVSFVYAPNKKDYLRVSYSSAIRNPTLSDQYLNFNVGRATLLGNLNGFTDLITVPSFLALLNGGKVDTLDYFNVAPIQPEKVQTIETGYRTTIGKKLYVDAGLYFSRYRDFIGYNIGVSADIDTIIGKPSNVKIYRIAANSESIVTTSGFNIGLNYYLKKYYMLSGNYSFNRLLTADRNDPIIPAFNTPEHKYNLSFSARDLPVNLGFVEIKSTGFNINYKWVKGFLFEGSPQFTGQIPNYSLLDAQWNAKIPKLNSTIKIGASNLLDNRQFQTYGGPRIGRMAYVSFLYEWSKN
jgi:iron complex outermembrane recepter protein